MNNSTGPTSKASKTEHGALKLGFRVFGLGFRKLGEKIKTMCVKQTVRTDRAQGSFASKLWNLEASIVTPTLNTKP